jgi:hypothetical protein
VHIVRDWLMPLVAAFLAWLPLAVLGTYRPRAFSLGSQRTYLWTNVALAC